MSDQKTRDLLDSIISGYIDLGKNLNELDKLYPKTPASDIVNLNLKPGDSIQNALADLAVSGGIINLAAGAYFSVYLKVKSTKLITIRGAEDFTTTLTGFTATNRSGNIGFSNLSFITPSGSTHVSLGGDRNGMKTVDDIPAGFTFQFVDFFGPCRRAIAANCADLLVENCNFKDYFVEGQDSQGIIGWNGSRNHIIRNNGISAASENIMYGGADAASDDMYPRDIEITGNTLTKELAWKGINYNIKALFELKNAQNVKFEHNTLHTNFKQAWGNAPAIVLKSCNQEGRNLLARCENIRVANNNISDVGTYFMLIGRNDGGQISGIMTNVVIGNNLCYGMNNEPDGRAISISGTPIGVKIDHNSIFDNKHSFVELMDSTIPADLRITNNIGHHGIYGIRPTTPTLPVEIFACNVLQVKSGNQPQVKLNSSCLYVPDVKTADLTTFKTTDGLPVGMNI